MIRTLLFFVFLFPAVFLSQSGMNNALRIRLDQRLDVFSMQQVLVKGNVEKLNQEERNGKLKLHYHVGSIASISCRLADVQDFLDRKVISYAEFVEARKKPLNDTMVVRNRILPVKTGASPLTRSYSGKGVVLGFIDTGIDFNHPDFKDANGKTRIAYIWDQSQSAGSLAPQPYNYGREWKAGQIDSGQCTHTGLAFYGHGTHVAGIAAGNGKANGRHAGCAPDADIIMVAIDFSKAGSTISDAANYILAKAAAMGKPCVVNASVGDYSGSHDGTDLEAQLLSAMFADQQGKSLVGAVGNAGVLEYHVKTVVQQDTAFTWLDPSGGITTEYWCYGDSLQIKNLKFSVGANRNNLSDVGRIGFHPYSYALNTIKKDTLFANGKRIGRVNSAVSVNSSGVYELYIAITPDTSLLRWRIETCGTGTQHAWNFYFQGGPLPPVQQFPFITKYRLPDDKYTVVSSFQCSEECITVANYCSLANFYDMNGVLRNTGDPMGFLAVTSSRGPTRDERQKPDVSATGHGVFSTFPLPLLANLVANTPSVVAQGSMHVISGGSSAASPVVAGLAALMLEKYPNATNRQIRDAIRFCTYLDNYTGYQLPDYNWGFGKVDGRQAFICAEPPPVLSLDGIGTWNEMSAAPNPFSDKFQIELPSDNNFRLRIFSVDGKLLLSRDITDSIITVYGNDFNSEKGLVIVQVEGINASYYFKLIRN